MQQSTSKFIKNYITLDISNIEKFTGKLIPGENVELKLIELYKYLHNEDDDPLVVFTKYLLNILFNKEGEYGYDKIKTFYDETYYLTTVISFLNKIEVMLFRSTEPDFIDIKFNKWIKKDELAEFVVIRRNYGWTLSRAGKTS